jgi:hypothetical protein
MSNEHSAVTGFRRSLQLFGLEMKTLTRTLAFSEPM